MLDRAIKYLNYSDDVFFYGLHRSEILKKAKFDGYWWPNNRSLANWAYVLQFDILLNGKITLVDEIDASGLITIMVLNFTSAKLEALLDILHTLSEELIFIFLY